MRAKRVVLVGGLVLATVLGVAGGYYAGEVTKSPYPVASGVAAPLGAVTASPTEGPLPRKTPKPDGYTPLNAKDLKFHRVNVTVDLVAVGGIDPPPVRMSVLVPIGWELLLTEKGEVKYQDPSHARWIRLATVFPVKATPRQKRDQLVPNLKANVSYENNLKIIDQSDDVLDEDDGDQRQVSTLRYSYIPQEWTRPVVVKYVATSGRSGANIEMSITGLAHDQKALDLIADKAAESVTPKD
ncbi:hypothetical protein OG474_13740 [Kribbella sp. NBC_01505]|uniref:hypothetical protein n=1 Tax=Kribbella sp. NBC_01505 TaxID=2903580 RepID=UPI003866C8A2